MSQSIFVVTPTGNIGSKLVADLLGRGETVHILARSPEKLPQAVRDSATVHVGDLGDEAFVTKASAGASALFWMTPPDYAAPDVRAVHARSAATAQAVVNANAIPYVVHVSSFGAQNDGFGPISLVRLVEESLNATAANVVHLRPGFFAENFLAQADAIKHTGAFYMSLPPEYEMPFVATADIAAVAADLLAARDFVGKTYRGVHGTADLSLAEAAKQLGDGTGLAIGYVQTTLEQTHEALLKMGMGADYARLYREMYGAFAANPNASAEARTAQTTTPTTLEAWAAQTLKPVVNP
ncbi:MAG: NAD(P)H-binding protein [Armatimonadetes bacterium]|nr:NAD(P)H-binding protein [Armatimonadota bacterium]